MQKTHVIPIISSAFSYALCCMTLHIHLEVNPTEFNEMHFQERSASLESYNSAIWRQIFNDLIQS